MTMLGSYDIQGGHGITLHMLERSISVRQGDSQDVQLG
jgi:hypothetical protein